jgi:lipoprotein-anchoring transpeptidase ErfK/SrfK
MIEPRSLRPRRVVLAGLVAALALSGCSNSADGSAAVTITATQLAAAPGDGVPVDASGSGSAPGSTSGSGGIVVLPPEEGPAAVTGSGSTGATTAAAPKSVVRTSPKAAGSSSPAAPKPTLKPSPKRTVKPAPTPKPKPRATVVIAPAAKAAGVDPLGRISVTAKGGTIVSVAVINPFGKVVGGGTVNKASWSWVPELGYGRQYIVRTVSRSTAGVMATTESTFTTVTPKKLVTVAVTPQYAWQTVGVAQPIVMKFSEPIADASRRKLESMIRIDRTGGQEGAFRWFSATELHWRPKVFWRAGITVQVTLDIYGKQLTGGGLYGAADTERSFKIGRHVTSEVDAMTHRMRVYQGARLLKIIPVSLGNDKYPTQNGVHVVSSKKAAYLMDSSTWGLVGAGAYRTNVKWATRISNSGEFVHGAPWSVFAQGKQNVSHGCINMTDANAKWFMGLSIQGDPVTVKRSKGPVLNAGDGFGDWTIPWNKY